MRTIGIHLHAHQGLSDEAYLRTVAEYPEKAAKAARRLREMTVSSAG